MTTININKLLPEQVQDLLYQVTRWKGENHEGLADLHDIKEAVKAVLAAPATAPEFPADWAQMIHYPECWDTAAYPELRDAIHEALAWSGCSVCKPATAPAWHDAPTVPGDWVIVGKGFKSELQTSITQQEIDRGSSWPGRWYGPIPPDGDKP